MLLFTHATPIYDKLTVRKLLRGHFLYFANSISDIYTSCNTVTVLFLILCIFKPPPLRVAVHTFATTCNKYNEYIF